MYGYIREREGAASARDDSNSPGDGRRHQLCAPTSRITSKDEQKKDRKERNAEKELDGLCLSLCVCVCVSIGWILFFCYWAVGC
jgi:hypothetical protein